jgi:hypothetical protein
VPLRRLGDTKHFTVTGGLRKASRWFPAGARYRQTCVRIFAWILDAAGWRDVIGKKWFRDLDSNQDTQLQRLMSYRLDDPGMVANTVPT